MGNVAFGSVNALSFNSLSRRDDLVSLAYMLVFLVTGELDFLPDEEEENQRDCPSEQKP